MPTTTNTGTKSRSTKATTKAPAPTPEVKDETTVEEEAPKRVTTSAASHFDTIKALVEKAGDEGITLKDLEKASGLTYRQVHNVTWRMEGSPKEGTLKKPEERILRRVNTGGSKVLYALRKPGDSAHMAGKFATSAPKPEGEGK